MAVLRVALPLCLLFACGRTSSDAEDTAAGSNTTLTGGMSSEMGGSGNTSGGAATSTSGGASSPVMCGGAYESLPVKTPPRALPTLFETELCNARDSRVWSIIVAADIPVRITLENPEVIDNFHFAAYRSDVDGYEALPVTAGATEARLGQLAERTLSFTPASAGVVALYASLGFSRGQSLRLSITQ